MAFRRFVWHFVRVLIILLRRESDVFVFTRMAGAVFGNQLSKNLAVYSDTIPPQVVKDVKQSVGAIFSLPPSQQVMVVTAYIRAVDYVYLITVPASIITILAALFIKNKSLKRKDSSSGTLAP